MRLLYLSAALALSASHAQQYDDYPDYQDYQDYGNYQDGYGGQEDNLYADYADRQAQKAV